MDHLLRSLDGADKIITLTLNFNGGSIADSFFMHCPALSPGFRWRFFFSICSIKRRVATGRLSSLLFVVWPSR